MARQRPPREIPPPLELECLRVLWKLGPCGVREVRRALLPARELAYTTVMTVLDRLVRRGAAERRKRGRAFVYEAALSREVLRRAAVNELLENFFDGSARELMAYLGEQRQQPAAAAAAATAGGGPAPAAVQAEGESYPTAGEMLGSAMRAAASAPAPGDDAAEAKPESGDETPLDPTLL